MRGFVDLHCHWIAAIDDGAKTTAESLEMLRGLRQVGFDHVVATPHMRPGMFDNDRARIESAFQAMKPVLATGGTLPSVHLASEHFFDDVVFGRLVRGEAVPYPRLPGAVDPAAGATARQRRRPVLIEFGPTAFPLRVQHRLFDLAGAGLVAVLAHPERYEPVWRDDACLDPVLDSGAYLLLDVCSLVGKYGRAPQRAALKLLEDEAYEAACSDAHKPRDVEVVAQAIERLEELVGRPETQRLLGDAPRAILGG